MLFTCDSPPSEEMNQADTPAWPLSDAGLPCSSSSFYFAPQPSMLRSRGETKLACRGQNWNVKGFLEGTYGLGSQLQFKGELGETENTQKHPNAFMGTSCRIEYSNIGLHFIISPT